MDRRTDAKIDRRTDGLTHGQTKAQKERRTYERTGRKRHMCRNGLNGNDRDIVGPGERLDRSTARGQTR